MVKGVTIDEDESSDDEARFASLGRTGDVRRVDANDDDDDAGSDDDAAPAMEEDSDDDAAPAMDADSDDDEHYEHKSRYEANDGDDSVPAARRRRPVTEPTPTKRRPAPTNESDGSDNHNDSTDGKPPTRARRPEAHPRRRQRTRLKSVTNRRRIRPSSTTGLALKSNVSYLKEWRT